MINKQLQLNGVINLLKGKSGYVLKYFDSVEVRKKKMMSVNIYL
jgi:hypothetical protein